MQLVQGVYLLAPWRKATTGPFPSTATVEYWDWSKVKVLCEQRGIPQPRIFFLGNGEQFNMPQIYYPWIVANKNVQAEWIWRFEDGRPDWHAIAKYAYYNSDLFITIPNYKGDPSDSQQFDNAYNAQVASILFNTGAFDAYSLEMGEIDPVPVVVLMPIRAREINLPQSFGSPDFIF